MIQLVTIEPLGSLQFFSGLDYWFSSSQSWVWPSPRVGYAMISNNLHNPVKGQLLGGMFCPIYDGELYYPLPAAITLCNNKPITARWQKKPNNSSMPSFLTYGLQFAKEKASRKAWISQKEWENYANNRPFNIIPEARLWEQKSSIRSPLENGVAKDGDLHSRMQMWLKLKTKLGYMFSCDKQFLEKNITVGSRRTVCPVQMEQLNEWKLPKPITDVTTVVEWTLFTPSIFKAHLKSDNSPAVCGGWMPNMVDEFGNITYPGVTGKLLGAAVLGFQDITGYSANSPLGVLRAVPAGTTYLFKVQTNEMAKILTSRLDWRSKATAVRRTDILGEQGFGLGVCRYITL